ncbi:MAG: VOC family protein, partial [Planctomycetota bacterium]|nr:VOC family protein [Planctomycetota bacterium]
DIALQALPKGTKHVSGNGVAKLHHFCFYVDKNEIIDRLYPILKRRRIPVVSGPETLVVAGNRSVSFLDPDGNRVEIACNANKFKFDNRENPRAATEARNISRKGAKAAKVGTKR